MAIKFVFNPIEGAFDAVETGYSVFSQAISDNQSSPANITGAVAGNANERTFEVQFYVQIEATSSLFESGRIYATQKAAGTWEISIDSEGDDSLVSFDIDTNGQIQSTSPTYPGYTAGTIAFKLFTGNTLPY